MRRSGIGGLGVMILLGLSGYGQSASGRVAGVAKVRIAMVGTGVGTVSDAITKHVTGAFDVKVIPQAADAAAGGAAVGRMLLDKQFHGALEAVSKGQMLASGTGAAGSSGGYVAMEFVTGTLDGRKGTFVLQHTATMNRGVPVLSITVVPDSGTEELVGLTGKMDIVIAAGKHTYVFDYTLREGAK